MKLRIGLVISFNFACSSGSVVSHGEKAPVEVSAEGSLTTLSSWTAAERDTVYHTSFGSRLLPDTWAQVMETADRSAILFSPENLRSYGFAIGEDNKPRGLVTTVLDREYNYYDNVGSYVGINCAACHTGEIHYQGQTLLIDGGSGRVDIQRFTIAIADALAAIENHHDRWIEFYHSVEDLGGIDATNTGTYERLYRDLAIRGGTWEGPGRSDTVSKGVNGFVRADEYNARDIAAPVSVPSLWDTHRFDYRHTTGSIRQALARDVSVAMAAGADVEFPLTKADYDDPAFASAVDIEALHTFEKLGEKLEPPAWPESMLGAINQALTPKGRSIYEARCASCHFGKTLDAELTLTLVPLADIGTDPEAATVLANEVVRDPLSIFAEVGLPDPMPLKDFLQMLTERVIMQAFEDRGFSYDQMLEYTENRFNQFRAPLAYKAMPLRGIWSTPPYLHNGSVRTLYELLRPSERAQWFRICADTEYDPAHVGLANETRASCFTFDTGISGNSAAGHSFGSDLSDEDVAALIEYLKTF